MTEKKPLPEPLADRRQAKYVQTIYEALQDLQTCHKRIRSDISAREDYIASGMFTTDFGASGLATESVRAAQISSKIENLLKMKSFAGITPEQVFYLLQNFASDVFENVEFGNWLYPKFAPTPEGEES